MSDEADVCFYVPTDRMSERDIIAAVQANMREACRRFEAGLVRAFEQSLNDLSATIRETLERRIRDERERRDEC